MEWEQRLISRGREFRHKHLQPLARFFLKLGISARLMTFIAFISGLGAAYFLFTNHLTFILLALLHLFADALDGVIAGISQQTVLGKYSDYGSDTLISLLVLLKIGWLLQDAYAFIAAGLYVLAHLVYIASKLTAPTVFMRTGLMITLFFYVPAIVSLSAGIPTILYMVTGVLSLYALARQVQWYAQKAALP